MGTIRHGMQVGPKAALTAIFLVTWYDMVEVKQSYDKTASYPPNSYSPIITKL